MGIKDKIKSSLRSVWSPITVWMAEEGSDRLVNAGASALVVVAVNGEDDGTADRIEITLELLSGGGVHAQSWPLGEVPATLGKHETTVTIPTELPPSCAQLAEYAFEATLHRTKGIGSSAKSVVDVVARPEDVYWPEGPRSGVESESATGLQISLDAALVAAGSSVSGRVHSSTGEPASLAMGAFVVSPSKPKGTYKETARLELAPGSAFSLLIPEGVPPTLHRGDCTVTWQVKATQGKATAWHWVAVVDPDGKAGIRDRPSPGLLSWLASLDSNPGYS